MKPEILVPAPSKDDLDECVCSVTDDENENAFTENAASTSKTETQILYKSLSMEAIEPRVEIIEDESEYELILHNVSEAWFDETLTVTEKSSSSIFTKTTVMPPETLPHSMKSGRSKIKSFEFGKTRRKEFPSVVSDTEIPKEEETKMAPLRIEITQGKVTISRTHQSYLPARTSPTEDVTECQGTGAGG
ncbi:hypothetical protein FQR65_LT02090 [Abscondita terminalis]|nr:hypothetical protein FQR65_LT02090 [Abscondita terminalis]